VRVKIQTSRFQVNDLYIQAVGTFEGATGTSSAVAPIKSALVSSAVLTA